MKLIRILENNFTVEAPKDGQKLENFKCNHCNQRYARHATRMGLHLLKCPDCPEEVKQQVKGKVNAHYIESLSSKNPLMWTKVVENFVRHPPEGNQKLDIYTCIHCAKKYSRNATRMNLHLLKCKECPPETKQMLSHTNKITFKQGVFKQGRSKHSKQILEESFVMHPAEGKQKLDMFQCKYCSQKYARHATRMSVHLLKCPGCPESVKQSLEERAQGPLSEVLCPKKSLLKFKKLIEDYFILLPRQANEKLEVVKCKYCSQKYARHATRMSMHLLKCVNCPENVKEHIQTYFIDRKEPPPAEASCSGMNADTSSGKLMMSRKDSGHCQDLLAKAIYASGAPFALVENEYWKQFFAALNPNFQLPTKKQLSTSLLDKSYRSIQISVSEQIKKTVTVGIQVESWISSGHDEMINIVLTTPEPLFYKTFSTQSMEDFDFYSNINSVIEDIGSNKVLGICMEKSSTSESACQILREKYEDDNIAFYFCALQSLQKIMKTLIEQQSVILVLKKATAVIKVIKYNGLLISVFEEMIADKPEEELLESGLELPVKGQWVSYLHCLESLFHYKEVLQSFAMDERVEEELEDQHKQILMDQEFWEQVGKVIRDLMKPIEKWILRLRVEDSKICEVPEMFSYLEKTFAIESEDPSTALLNSAEVNEIVQKIQEEANATLHPIHYAANILNPEYRGEILSQEAYVEGQALVSKLSSKLGISEDTILVDLANYNSNKGIWSENYVKKSISLMSPINWWHGVCKRAALSKIACAILSLPCMSITSIKKRPPSREDPSGKTTFISHNLKLLENLFKIEQASVDVQKEQFILPDSDYTFEPIYVENDDVEMFDENEESDVKLNSSAKEVKIAVTNIKSENSPSIYYQLVDDSGEIYFLKQDQ